MNCYHHFTIEERTCLRKYYMEGLSFRKIAKLLGRSPSSISREIARNYTSRYEYNTYYPHTAHKKYLFRRRFCHRGMFGNEEVVAYITEKLQVMIVLIIKMMLIYFQKQMQKILMKKKQTIRVTKQKKQLILQWIKVWLIFPLVMENMNGLGKLFR